MLDIDMHTFFYMPIIMTTTRNFLVIVIIMGMKMMIMITILIMMIISTSLCHVRPWGTTSTDAAQLTHQWHEAGSYQTASLSVDLFPANSQRHICNRRSPPHPGPKFYHSYEFISRFKISKKPSINNECSGLDDIILVRTCSDNAANKVAITLKTVE